MKSIPASILITFACLVAVLSAGCRRPLADGVSYSEGNVALLRTTLGGDKAAAETPVAMAEPTGWATLRGVFKLNGTPPPRAALNIDKEQNVCMPGGKPVFAENIVVGAGGGIKDVVIYLETKYPAGNPKWEHPDYASLPAEVPFDQKDCKFLTHVFAMRTSQVLKVSNSDPPATGHNTKLDGGGDARQDNFTVPGGGSSQNYSPGGESPEPFKVQCSIHTWMSAYGIVRKSPYFAVTKPSGEFEIKNLPAGVPLKFRVWQEKTQFIRDLKTTGKLDKYSKGRMELKLDPEEQRQLELVVDASLFQ